MTGIENLAPYGYCPICGAKGVTRERRLNGNDRCENGHTYPSAEALEHPDYIAARAEPTTVLGDYSDNPVLKDISDMHVAGLDLVRARVATAVAQSQTVAEETVFAVSFISVNDRPDGQMIVYSPGGMSLGNASIVHKRLVAAQEQLQMLIDAGKFG